MQSLIDIQSGVRRAVVTGEFAHVADSLVGGRRAEHRLAIHRRHYEASLVGVLLDKFPAATWLVGSRVHHGSGPAFCGHAPAWDAVHGRIRQGFPGILGGPSGR